MSTKSAASRHGVSCRRPLIALAICAGLLLPGCFTFSHTVGRGVMSPTPEVVEETQWFALWGLTPIGTLDSQTLAGSARDYTVTTKFTVWDVVISAFTSFATFYRQTVIVEK